MQPAFSDGSLAINVCCCILFVYLLQLLYLLCSLSVTVAGGHSLSSVRSTVTTFKLSASYTLQIRFATAAP